MMPTDCLGTRRGQTGSKKQTATQIDTPRPGEGEQLHVSDF